MNSPLADASAALDAPEMPSFAASLVILMRGSPSNSRSVATVSADEEASSHRHSSQLA